MCYTNKNKKKINSLETKNREKLDYKKLRLGDDYQYPSQEEQEKKQEEETISDVNKFNERVNKQETGINTELFKKHFKIQRPSDMLKYLYLTNDRKKNHELVNMINSGLKDLKKEIKKMSKEERKIEKPDKIVKIVKKILNFNKQNPKGKGLKILTPNQMLSRLPITLAQLKAGNNSEKLKNEIRQLLYSLYRSKNMTKQVYNNLIKPIWIKNIIIAHKIFIMIMIMIKIIIIIIIIIIIVTIKGTHYKNGDNFYEYWKK